MKLSDLDININEEAAAGVTSVASIGKVEYAAFPDRIKLYKRDANNCPSCIAQFKRKRKQGWSFVTTKNWGKMKLPHFGHLENANTKIKGMKTHSHSLPDMLKAWGIRYDDLVMKGSE